MATTSALIQQTYTQSPNLLRDYYGIQIICPTCKAPNTYIFYNITNKAINKKYKCTAQHNIDNQYCLKYKLPIQQINDIHDTYKSDHTEYHALIDIPNKRITIL